MSNMTTICDDPADLVRGLVGKVLQGASVDRGKDTFRLVFQDGTVQEYRVDGDCCSVSWIEHFDIPPDLDGAILLGANESDPVGDDEDPDHEGVSILVYSTKFHTTKGGITLEYRNESNGYYGGYITRL